MLVVSFLVLFCVRSAVLDWNRVTSGSMAPAIPSGTRILVHKCAYDLRLPFTTLRILARHGPRRGDVIVFRSPEDGHLLVKRVIGLPGETVALNRNKLAIDGQLATYVQLHAQGSSGDGPTSGFVYFLEEHKGSRRVISQDERSLHDGQHTFGPQQVPANEYFVLGDNRDLSDDSRHFGFISRHRVIGRVLLDDGSSSVPDGFAAALDNRGASNFTLAPARARGWRIRLRDSAGEWLAKYGTRAGSYLHFAAFGSACRGEQECRRFTEVTLP
jgi:signal peptidase I